MKKSVIVCLILSFVLLLAGGLLVYNALKRTGFDWNKLAVYTVNETFDYDVDGEVHDIRIDAKQADVRVQSSKNGTCAVRAKVASRESCSVENIDGVLYVTVSGQKKEWYRRVWRQDETNVTVYLPDEAYEKLVIETGSGDVYVSETLIFTIAHAKTGAGDLEVYAPVTDDLSATTGSGEITVKAAECKTFSVATSSGTILCEDCKSENMTAKTSSGEVFLTQCTAETVRTNTGSGDIFFSHITVSNLLDVNSSSGDVSFTNSTAGAIQIVAKSGDISGTLAEPMLFDVRSDSGDIVLPASGGTHTCTVRTGSGDVTFTLQETAQTDD